jgi:hypothetical protein
VISCHRRIVYQHVYEDPEKLNRSAQRFLLDRHQDSAGPT